MKNTTKIFFVAGSVLLIAGAFFAGTYVGFAKRPYIERVTSVTGKEAPLDTLGSTDFEPFWKVWKIIDEKYPGADKVTAQARVYGAISGLVNSLEDPYSVYFPPEESKDFEEAVNGSFEGVGMEVGLKDKIITVIAPLKDSPAEKAGIKAGDILLKIDGLNTNDMTVDKAIKLIRGKAGTAVKLSLYRDGDEKPRDVEIVRAVITIPTLETEMRSDGVYVIRLYNFGPTSASQMANALIDFNSRGGTKLVIDLRNNPGGYLDAAVNIASLFLPEGEVIVTEDFGENGKPKSYRSKGFELFDTKTQKVAVLIDRGSASASEIVAGALREHKIAPLIGETTYGKGSVQEVVEVTKDTTLKLTIAKWLTPNGVSISEEGLKPDIEMEVTAEDLEADRDPVLERAVEYFRTGR